MLRVEVGILAIILDLLLVGIVLCHAVQSAMLLIVHWLRLPGVVACLLLVLIQVLGLRDELLEFLQEISYQVRLIT